VLHRPGPHPWASDAAIGDTALPLHLFRPGGGTLHCWNQPGWSDSSPCCRAIGRIVLLDILSVRAILTGDSARAVHWIDRPTALPRVVDRRPPAPRRQPQ